MISASHEFGGSFRNRPDDWLSADLPMTGSIIAADALAWGMGRPGNVRCVYDSDAVNMHADLPTVANEELRHQSHARLQQWLRGERPGLGYEDPSWPARLVDSVPRSKIDGDRVRICSFVPSEPEIHVHAVAGQLQFSLELRSLAPLTGICQAALAEYLWAAHSNFRMVRAEMDTCARLVSRIDFDQFETMCPIVIKQLQFSARRVRNTVGLLAQERAAIAYLER